MISYSIAIRTLGTAGERYQKLLDSIERLTIQPEKVVVVLPFGYKEPKEKIGIETFLFSEKGMVQQRTKALEAIESEYTLFLDDDVEFEEDFVEKLSEPLEVGRYECSSAPLIELLPNGGDGGVKYLFASILGGSCIMLRDTERYFIRILNTGGWSYNRKINRKVKKYYDTESLPGACFMICTNVMRKIRFHDEGWCERSGYAAYEDRILFYKLFIQQYKICIVSNARYVHNDARTSHSGLKSEPFYNGAFNHFVFWHRFIYRRKYSFLSRRWAKICIWYYQKLQLIYQWFKGTKMHNYIAYVAMKEGFADAKRYVREEEYLNVPPPVN